MGPERSATAGMRPVEMLDVGALADFPIGEIVHLEIPGKDVNLLRCPDDRLYAFKNTCPHQGGPLCQGVLTGFSEPSAPGEYRYSRRGEILRCPWHGWEFDLLTGRSWFDPLHTRVRRYEVEVVPGPYLAETYPVSVEDDYLVVDL